MEMRKWILAAVAVMTLAACGGGDGEKHQPRTDSEAWQRGQVAAAALVLVDHADTMALQQAILDAKAVQSRWVMQGDSAAVADFEAGFAAYLHDNDPALHQAIFPSE